MHFNDAFCFYAFRALTPLVGRQEGHLVRENAQASKTLRKGD